MPSTICTPISGRLRLAASELFLSVFGLPVSGSFGSFSHMMVPHSAPPQSATRMREVPVWVSQVPVGSAASAASEPTSASNAAAARYCAILMSVLLLASTVSVLAHYPGRRKGGQRFLRPPSRRSSAAPLRLWLPAREPARLAVCDQVTEGL